MYPQGDAVLVTVKVVRFSDVPELIVHVLMHPSVAMVVIIKMGIHFPFKIHMTTVSDVSRRPQVDSSTFAAWAKPSV